MWDEQFEILVRSQLPFLTAGEKLHPDLDLRQFGLDSLGVVDLLISLESAYNVRLADDILSMETFATPAALWAALSGIGHAAVLPARNPDGGRQWQTIMTWPSSSARRFTYTTWTAWRLRTVTCGIRCPRAPPCSTR